MDATPIVDNTSLLKYTLLMLATPIWWPVLKALWVEVNRMLAEDGGVFGRLPSAGSREELRREQAELGDPLISDPIYSRQQRAAGRRGLADRSPSRAGTDPAGPASARRGAGPPPRKRGFR